MRWLLLLPLALLGSALGTARADDTPASLPTLALRATLAGPQRLVRAVAFDRAGTVLIVGTSDRTLHVFDAETQRLRAEHKLPRSG